MDSSLHRGERERERERFNVRFTVQGRCRGRPEYIERDNYASHAESPNRDPEESHTRCRVKIQNTDRGRGRSKGGKCESYEMNETMYWRKKYGEREEENSR